MRSYEIPKSEFVPHPDGQHQGTITDVEDKGNLQTKYGDGPKVAVKIESSTAKMDDGRGFIISRLFSLSSHPKSSLRQFREEVLGRKLSDTEARKFVPEQELFGRRVRYRVEHKGGPEGVTYANLVSVYSDGDPSDTQQNGDNQEPPSDPDASTSGLEFPGDAEGAAAKVLAKARANSTANVEWVKSKLEEQGTTPNDATRDQWRKLWSRVDDDLSF